MAEENTNKHKIGLVLEGGGMRGLFSAGVTDAMMEQGIVVDGAIGVSAGICFGCNYKSHQIGRALRYNMAHAHKRDYMSLWSLITTGNYINADFAFHRVPMELDVFDEEAFNANPMEMHLVATDVETGEAEYHKCTAIKSFEGLEWVRASSSMPLVSTMVPLQGRLYLDGGIADSIPLKYFQSIGYEKCIVVLTRERGYRKKGSAVMNALCSIVYRKFPKLVQAIKNRPEIYNAELDYLWEQEKAGNVLVICPETAPKTSRVESKPEELRKIHGTGYALAMKMMPKIKEFALNTCKNQKK